MYSCFSPSVAVADVDMHTNFSARVLVGHKLTPPRTPIRFKQYTFPGKLLNRPPSSDPNVFGHNVRRRRAIQIAQATSEFQNGKSTIHLDGSVVERC
jgi:hypothetical protein